MTQSKESAQTFEYKAEMKQLLHLIIHSLYTHPEVFLRELISNASDALNKVRYRMLTDKEVVDPDVELAIRITVDEKAKTFSIEDTGIGMTRDELITNIGTVARSGTQEFLAQLQQAKDSAREQLIGQFGVGFYSVFMVTDEVTLETRSPDKEGSAYRWKSTGAGSYTIEECDRATRGTKITFTFKESADEFAHLYTIKDTIQKYSNFADFPIYVGDERVNTVSALWRKQEAEVTEEELKAFYTFMTHDHEAPLGHLQLSIESTGANFKALIFVPAKAPIDFLRQHDQESLHLYTNKILIQRNCKELLPEYLRFLRGVVDTADLPLNVSRETVQSSPAMHKITSTVTSKVLAMLKGWAKNDPEKYTTFYKNFGVLFKTGVNTDFANREKVIELLRFESTTTKDGSYTSLADYVSRMKPGQKDIYYISGEHKDALRRNPNLEYFRKKELEVLLLTDPVDIFVMPSINEFDKKPIKSIDKSDVELMPEDTVEKPTDNLSQDVVGLFKETLKDKIADVVISKRLVDSAVTLVTDKDGLDPQMEKMIRLMNRDAAMPVSKKILEINTDHPVIKNLSRLYLANKSDAFIAKCIMQLYEGALFIDGELPASSDFISRMNEIMSRATA